ncbi:MAG: hypothetical protein C0506_15415 [Anaerolinea sp.]|nr:hypothetical protein [Anaerolinea sp.]
MRWGYVLGPLTLLPLLGALFLVPRPEDEGGPRFDRASLSLLECHIQAAAFFAFRDDDVAAVPVAEVATRDQD